MIPLEHVSLAKVRQCAEDKTVLIDGRFLYGTVDSFAVVLEQSGWKTVCVGDPKTIVARSRVGSLLIVSHDLSFTLSGIANEQSGVAALRALTLREI